MSSSFKEGPLGGKAVFTKMLSKILAKKGRSDLQKEKGCFLFFN